MTDAIRVPLLAALLFAAGVVAAQGAETQPGEAVPGIRKLEVHIQGMG